MHCRTTVAPWFRGLFTSSPEVTTIAQAPVIYEVHVTAAWLIWAVWPFSRLVHAWSYPLWYLWRPYIVCRSRRAVRTRRARHQRPPVTADRRAALTGADP
jgi:nitrate reductase gamma subunit